MVQLPVLDPVTAAIRTVDDQFNIRDAKIAISEDGMTGVMFWSGPSGDLVTKLLSSPDRAACDIVPGMVLRHVFETPNLRIATPRLTHSVAADLTQIAESFDQPGRSYATQKFGDISGSKVNGINLKTLASGARDAGNRKAALVAMDKLDGVSLEDQKISDEELGQLIRHPDTLKEIGKLMAVDAILHNSDRFGAVRWLIDGPISPIHSNLGNTMLSRLQPRGTAARVQLIDTGMGDGKNSQAISDRFAAMVRLMKNKPPLNPITRPQAQDLTRAIIKILADKAGPSIYENYQLAGSIAMTLPKLLDQNLFEYFMRKPDLFLRKISLSDLSLPTDELLQIAQASLRFAPRNLLFGTFSDNLRDFRRIEFSEDDFQHLESGFMSGLDELRQVLVPASFEREFEQLRLQLPEISGEQTIRNFTQTDLPYTLSGIAKALEE